MPVPVLFLNSQLKLIYASREGYAACAECNFGQKSARRLNPRRSYQLPPTIAEACQKLGATERDAPKTKTETDRKLRVPHPSDSRLVAQVVIDLPLNSPWTRPVYRVLFFLDRSIDDVALSAKPSALALLQRLTANERRVALLVTEGCNNREIGERIGKSNRTVECQLTEIYRKLEVENRVQLTRILV